VNIKWLSEFYDYFDQARIDFALDIFPSASWSAVEAQAKMLRIYNDRSTSRVSDVSSVVLRDIILWSFLVMEKGEVAYSLLSQQKKEILEGFIRRSTSEPKSVEFGESELNYDAWGTLS